ncbi:MAG: hypothetical protein Q7U98_19730 [Methylicorpusculum sp.]|uniref:hypothetical protein n=1 Tax=Methylicorpusculum sp. TaxID=2713644 RepID=UPI0027281F05|nr:hypothetical protein [Methylicorpusculum sp.]MDO8941393.1 hypothetical protein [Methylicorpusculum sp.]MDO9238388.1 hypothetical protein [Methylicorpusculum sp.]MDP2203016.1 hypothetical protein [Methylicorpusculum sp.]
MEVIIFFMLIVIVWAALSNNQRQKALLAKYKDAEVVDMIINKIIWQNQTSEQLIDSLGQPADVDRKVMKTKIREVWKYFKTGKRRYALRITLENGVVVGWDKKS